MSQGACFGEREGSDPGKESCPDLDFLALLVHHLHVVVELCNICEPSEVLLLLGQKFLNELVQVVILRQLQQPEVGHLIALKTLTLALLPVLLYLES